MVVEKTIQKVPVLSFALMSACIGAVIGIIVGIFYAVTFGIILSSIPSASSSATVIPSVFGLFLGIGAIIVVPIMAFVGGLIQGAIIALVYNFLAPRIGGIKVQFKEDNPTIST